MLCFKNNMRIIFGLLEDHIKLLLAMREVKTITILPDRE